MKLSNILKIYARDLAIIDAFDAVEDSMKQENIKIREAALKRYGAALVEREAYNFLIEREADDVHISIVV